MADSAGAAPRAAYRVQLRNGVGFAQVEGLLPYLAELGVSTLYLSPALAARSGSPHGYDVIDPLRVDEALGGEDGLRRLAGAAHAAGLSVLLDIVPNHLAASDENPRWREVLRLGPDAPAAGWFDIDWAPEDLPFENRVFLPVLDAPLPEVLRAGRLGLEPSRDGGLDLVHHGHRFALRPETADAARRAYEAGPTPDRLFELLRRQHYRLGWWRSGTEKRNYRRFFDIDELVCVRNEDPAVAEATHQCVHRLVGDGVVDGLRVDHIDGLRDPAGYLVWLRRHVQPRYLLVEKILAADEALPEDWPVDGTTGYEFLNAAARLFVDPAGFQAMRAEAAASVGAREFDEVLWESKRDVLKWLFPRELDALKPPLERLAERDVEACDLPRAAIHAALEALTAALRVYRTYMRVEPPREADLNVLHRAAQDAAARRPPLRPALDFLCRALRGDLDPDGPPDDYETRALPAAWQLLTGPAAAKGLEDTALYRDVALVALNEVGGEPTLPDDAVHAFHALNAHRRQRWPRALNATTTHDTKRSEDVRARIAALSEYPDAWVETVGRWQRLNAPLRRDTPEGPAPDPAMERLLYQTLVGTWPLEAGFDRGAYTARIVDYMIKAAREAKLRTRWRAVDEDYEAGLKAFVSDVLDPERSESFVNELEGWVVRVGPTGAVTGLAQTLFKCAAPGVPDIYQGSELWDLRLVDPDNRGPVDFRRRRSALDGIVDAVRQTGSPATVDELRRHWRDGRIKLFTLWRVLNERARDPALFDAGAYLPLGAHARDGEPGPQVCGFARQHGSRWALAAAPRRAAPQVRGDPLGVDPEAWAGAALSLPPGAPGAWREAFTGGRLECAGAVAASDLFARFPVALLFGGED